MEEAVTEVEEDILVGFQEDILLGDLIRSQAVIPEGRSMDSHRAVTSEAEEFVRIVDTPAEAAIPADGLTPAMAADTTSGGMRQEGPYSALF